MALEKSWTDPYGVVHAECYWRLTAWPTNVIGGFMDLTLARYHNAAARAAGKDPFPELFTFTVTAATTPTLAEALALMDGLTIGMRPEMYAILKNRPELAGAIDV
mgnify:CR=1 FL=1